MKRQSIGGPVTLCVEELERLHLEELEGYVRAEVRERLKRHKKFIKSLTKSMRKREDSLILDE